eukprot:6209928-Pleurochrysis_carterae.AAC.1
MHARRVAGLRFTRIACPGAEAAAAPKHTLTLRRPAAPARTAAVRRQPVCCQRVTVPCCNVNHAAPLQPLQEVQLNVNGQLEELNVPGNLRGRGYIDTQVESDKLRAAAAAAADVALMRAGTVRLARKVAGRA